MPTDKCQPKSERTCRCTEEAAWRLDSCIQDANTVADRDRHRLCGEFWYMIAMGGRASTK